MLRCRCRGTVVFLGCLLWWWALWVASGFGLVVCALVVSLVYGVGLNFWLASLWVVGFRMVTGLGLVGMFSFGVVLLVIAGSLCLNCLLLFWVDCWCLWLGSAEVFGYGVVWGWYFVGFGLWLVWFVGLCMI